MAGREDDDAWRQIVDNFGDRADLGPDEPVTPPAPAPIEDDADSRSWDQEYVDSDWSTGRFVPPPPPPLPVLPTDRLVAWMGVFGAPAALLICLVLSITLPQLIAYALVAAFVGGFLYLVVKMSREPRDPGDDGARL